LPRLVTRNNIRNPSSSPATRVRTNEGLFLLFRYQPIARSTAIMKVGPRLDVKAAWTARGEMNSTIKQTWKNLKPSWNCAYKIMRVPGNMRSEASRTYPLSSHPPLYDLLKASRNPPTFTIVTSQHANPIRPRTVPLMTNARGETCGSTGLVAGNRQPALTHPHMKHNTPTRLIP